MYRLRVSASISKLKGFDRDYALLFSTLASVVMLEMVE